MGCLNPDYCGTGDKETLCDNCDKEAQDSVVRPKPLLMLNEREAKAIARVVKDQWINRDDMEAMEVVDKICEYANPKTPIKPLEKPDEEFVDRF